MSRLLVCAGLMSALVGCGSAPDESSSCEVGMDCIPSEEVFAESCGASAEQTAFIYELLYAREARIDECSGEVSDGGLGDSFVSVHLESMCEQISYCGTWDGDAAVELVELVETGTCVEAFGFNGISPCSDLFL